MRAYVKLKLVSKRTQCLLEWQSEDSSVATLYYKKKSFNTNNLFKFRITLCNISTALQEHFSTVLNVGIVSDSDDLKQELSQRFNCPATLRISTLVYCSCHYPISYSKNKSSTGLTPVESNLLCSRSGVSEILQRIFKKREVHVCFKPHSTRRQRLVRPK